MSLLVTVCAAVVVTVIDDETLEEVAVVATDAGLKVQVAPRSIYRITGAAPGTAGGDAARAPHE